MREKSVREIFCWFSKGVFFDKTELWSQGNTGCLDGFDCGFLFNIGDGWFPVKYFPLPAAVLHPSQKRRVKPNASVPNRFPAAIENFKPQGVMPVEMEGCLWALDMNFARRLIL
jgi:hypothetical protein